MVPPKEEEFDESLATLFQKVRTKNKENTAARHSTKVKPITENEIQSPFSTIVENAGLESSSGMSSSEATLFKIAREDEERKHIRRNEKEEGGEDHVEKLITLLNGYANWEIKSILISIFNEGNGEKLKERLVGKDQDTAKTDETSASSSDEDGGNSIPSKTSSTKKGCTGSSTGRGDSSRTPHRRSRSNESLRNSDEPLDELGKSEDKGRRKAFVRSGSFFSSRGKKPRPRSLSSERFMGTGGSDTGRRRTSNRDSSGNRQAYIIAKRKELDKMKHPSTGTTTSSRRERRHSRTSLSPSRIRQPRESETEEVGSLPPSRVRHSSSTSKEGSVSPSTVGRSSCTSKVGSETTEGVRSVSPNKVRHSSYIPSRGVGKSGSADNLLGLGSSSYHIKRPPKANRNATLNKHGLGTSLHGTRSGSGDKFARSHGLRRSESSIDEHQSGRSVPLGPQNTSEVGFLQFQPDTNEKSQVATSFKHAVKVDALVDELRASAHNPINAVIGKSAKDGDTQQARGAGKKKHRLGFLGRKSKNKDEVAADDHGESEASNDSDEESFS
jgi:hypothetical protein